MEKIFYDSAKLEKSVKEYYGIPDFLMMENAAINLKTLILDLLSAYKIIGPAKIFILCGKGNNGADGLCLARLLQNHKNLQVFITSPQEHSQLEAKTQFSICKKLGINILNSEDFSKELKNQQNEKNIFIVDCLYGTGFKGQWKKNDANLIQFINQSTGIKIACDLPSGITKDGSIGEFEEKSLAFKANYTLSMGCLKLGFYSDEAKEFTGKILLADLGIDSQKFQSMEENQAFLIQKEDLKLPFRTQKSSHKGSYGHSAIFAGEKSGAGIISATAALHFGSGLTSLIKTKDSNLEQFKISPELMISDKIPDSTNCVLLGPGLGDPNKKENEFYIETLKTWFKKSKKANCVLDADIFNYRNLNLLLEEINKYQGNIILTPHPKEQSKLFELCNFGSYGVKEIRSRRIELGKAFVEKFNNICLVLKGANTVICIYNKEKQQSETFVCSDGCPALAKGGSGDVLAGLITALLAQNYSLQDSAITAVETHALAASLVSEEDFSLSPEILIENIIKMNSK